MLILSIYKRLDGINLTATSVSFLHSDTIQHKRQLVSMWRRLFENASRMIHLILRKTGTNNSLTTTNTGLECDSQQ